MHGHTNINQTYKFIDRIFLSLSTVPSLIFLMYNGQKSGLQPGSDFLQSP